MLSRNLVFWEVDVQADFMLPGGKLYVPGAEKLLPNIRKLTDAARRGWYCSFAGHTTYPGSADLREAAAQLPAELILVDTVDGVHQFFQAALEGRPDRVEVEAGRRQIVGGSLGNTTAHFGDGDSFVLEPEDRKSGWVGRLRGIGGSAGFHIAGEVGAEERDSRVGLSARASLTLGL